MKKPLEPNALLRQARLARGWTQHHLADEVGVDEQTVRSWERGKRFPSLSFRSRLCAIFEKTPEQLGLLPADGSEHISQESSLPSVHPVDAASPFLPEAAVVDLQPRTRIPSRTLNWAETNRYRMLDRVHSRWIAGVLDHSLYRATLITLGLREQPDAVENPWHLSLQESNLPPRPLPAGTRITDVYDNAGGELLILGEPGAGKTTLLLELTHDLLERAMHDHTHPMPVVFNVSSWAQKRQPFADWLIEELDAKYQIPHKLGQSWVTTDQILPLLDGLDEVAETHRTACVEAMNIYRQEHGLVPMVLCSRSTDYLTQAARILLHTAVVVQPLTARQIDDFLASAGEHLAAMRVVLQHDPILQEMARTPLMLSILALTYHEMSLEDALAVDSLTSRRRIVFEHYIERMLGRRGPTRHYTIQQTKHWLGWLARQLAQHSQTEFYVERMQPDWLPESRPRQYYQRTIVRLIFGIQIIINAGLFSWLRGGNKGNVFGVGVGLLGALGAGPGNRILGWMAPGLGGGLEGGGSLGIFLSLVTVLVLLLVSVPIPTLSMQTLWHGLSKGLRNGLKIGVGIGIFAGLVFSTSGGLDNALYRGAGIGLWSLLLIGLTTGLIAGLSHEQNSEHSHQNRPNQEQPRAIRSVRPLVRLLDVLIFSLCAGLAFGSVNSLLVGGVNQTVVIYVAIVGCFYGIAFGVAGGTDLIRGLGTAIQPAETVAWSWRNVGQNLAGNSKKGLLVGLSVMVPVMVIIGCASGLFYGAGYGLRYGLLFGLIVGLVGGVAGILMGMLKSGWSSNMLAPHQLFRPNEGIRRSLKNAGFAACLFGPLGGIASGLFCGVAFGLVGGLPGWPILGAGFAIVFSIIFALQVGMIHGGIASIEHYVLRWYLWRAGHIPWNYVAFLDYAAERILLSKVGGGYLFSHRLLLDHFATLLASDEEASQARSSTSD